ncbi:MAG: TonB family protein [Candidatus Acidiferrum sp.]
MAPLSKENEVLTIPPDTKPAGSTTSETRHEDTSTSRPQPVALEVPVTVNGARTVEGSDKREPFSETTKTVLIFGTGAVIRLGSPVAAGQLLFLTNEKTKKEVVCQVVKSKNYRNVSGYVELEFTESVVGFWGMRFPTDRIGTAAPAISTTTPPKGIPAAPNPTLPAPSIASTATRANPKAPEIHVGQVPAAAKPEIQSRPAAVTPITPSGSNLGAQAGQPTIVPATLVVNKSEAPASSLSASLTSSGSSLLTGQEAASVVPPPKPATTPIAPESKPALTTHAAENSTGELRQQAARLQEQLSSLLFEAAPSSKPAPPTPAIDPRANTGVASKVLEMAKPELAPVKVTPPVKMPPPIKSSLDTEEVKIPSWLEPLARNAAVSTPAHEHAEREKSKHVPETVAHEEHASEHAPAAEAESSHEIQMPLVGSMFQLEEGTSSKQHSSDSSRKGLWIGVAVAAVVLVAGGAWYEFNPANAPKSTSAPVSSKAIVPTAPTNAETRPDEHLAQRNQSLEHEAASEATATPRSNAPANGEPVTKSPSSSQPIPVTRDNSRETATTVPAAVKERISRPVPAPEPEPKKPALGEVHLESPTVNRAEASQGDQVVAPTLATGTSNASPEGIGSGLAAGDSKQPAIPAPIGGDVKPAVMISHVAPRYPALALSQHVTGDVVIDALIDATGRVTAMTVISGPTLLHQAAKDALRQWKYQPASLDGKAVSMHLTVTLQFRM